MAAVEAVAELQFLLAMGRVFGGIQVDDDAAGRGRPSLDEELQNLAAEGIEIPGPAEFSKAESVGREAGSESRQTP